MQNGLTWCAKQWECFILPVFSSLVVFLTLRAILAKSFRISLWSSNGVKNILLGEIKASHFINKLSLPPSYL